MDVGEEKGKGKVEVMVARQWEGGEERGGEERGGESRIGGSGGCGGRKGVGEVVDVGEERGRAKLKLRLVDEE